MLKASNVKIVGPRRFTNVFDESKINRVRIFTMLWTEYNDSLVHTKYPSDNGKAVEGVMADRWISKRLKGKIMSTCVTLACLYGTETLALTELQQQRLQVCENNWVQKIARVTRADRRRMVELREETGVQRSLTERLVRSRLQWAGHVERMADDRLPKRATELCEQGRRTRGDEGGQVWDGKTVLREMWGRQERRKTGRRRQETEEGGKDYQMRRWKSCGQHLTPDKGKRGRERWVLIARCRR